VPGEGIGAPLRETNTLVGENDEMKSKQEISKSSSSSAWQMPRSTLIDLARALMSLLEHYGISRTDIGTIFRSRITGLELKVAGTLGNQCAAINGDNGADFCEIFKTLLESVGVMYNPTTSTLVWVGIDVPFQIKLTCGEDFAAAIKRGGQPGFDAVKAISNVLRALYLLQEHQKVKLDQIPT